MVSRFNFTFNQEMLKEILKSNPSADQWYIAICRICPDYNIDTVNRLAAFIAQCAHESGGFKYLQENLNYKAETLMKQWPKRFPTLEIAKKYEKQPQKIANYVYANRMGNGDESSGDGWKYIGRGLIQLTGKDNYSKFAESVNMNLEDIVKHLQTIEGAVQSACFFWKNTNLNQWADKDDMVTLTKRINGGTSGLDDRIAYYNRILKIFKR